MSSLVKEFNAYRTRMNEVILGKNNLVMKHLWNLDTNTYKDGALDRKTKEMLALVVRQVGSRVLGGIGVRQRKLAGLIKIIQLTFSKFLACYLLLFKFVINIFL